MPVVDHSIIAPGVIDSRSPMKKSTVFWIFLILILFIAVGYYGPRMFKESKDTTQEPIKAAPPSKGSEKDIDKEMADAGRQAEKPPKNTAESKPVVPAMPMPTPMPSNRELQSGDQNASHIPAGDGTETEAGGRVSKSIVVDAGGTEIADLLPSAAVSKPPERKSTTETRAEQTEQLLKLAKSSIAAGPKSARELDRDWLQEYKDLKPTPAIRPRQVASRYTLVQGKVIPAVLGKALNSDLPGDITAFTTMDIYDSLESNFCLIPKGSMLIGEYSNRVRAGQARLMFAFTRIVLPNGLSFDLPGNKGQDQMGAAGITGDVNNHYFQRYASALLIAFLSDKIEASKTTAGTTNVYGGAQGPTTSAGTVLAEVTRDDLARNKEIQPTITVPAGTRINVQVSADMEFPNQYPRCKVN